MNRLKSNSYFILYLVCISAFIASLNQNIYSPIIPLIRDSFHVSVTMVNLSVSIFIFITAVMQIIFGSLLDFKGTRSVLISSILLTVAASIACAITRNFTVFFISRILQAVGTAAIPLIAATTIGRLFQGNQRGSAMGTYQMLLSVAPAAAPVLGGFIGERYGYPGVFWFLVGVSVILLLINWLFFPEDDIDCNQAVSLKTLALHYTSIFKNKVGSSVLLLSFCIFFLYFSIMVYLPVLLADHYHLSLKIVGLLYLPMALSLILGSIAYKFLQAKISFRKLLAFGNILASSSILLFAVAHLYTLAGTSVILALHGMAVGMLTPLFATRITNEFEHNRGSAVGMFNFIRYMGMAGGPVLSGLLLNVAPSALVFGAFGILFALLSYIMFIRIK
ncbi:MFS transporter [Paenibacillus sp. N3/727]|uniref:MFS transporter n=1 Tax=Paenibacillus sp. N3/727 TaxID=2925845 RepID=UPI001F534120|nr:MFS transporter [Paenibacillus sp. N3/727]UNK21206.1 MFS transporter [Paenibacillus sp. N3/727]